LREQARIYVDGASRGNPGQAGIGVILVVDGGVKRLSEYIGFKTNNEAEYMALIRGLETALEMGVRDAVVYSDSQLLVQQLRGSYRVRSRRLKRLYERALELISQLASFQIIHVDRSENMEADRLANQAIDKKVV
jgi:ribonuclease HI